jgi:hypothetical protein
MYGGGDAEGDEDGAVEHNGGIGLCTWRRCCTSC